MSNLFEKVRCTGFLKPFKDGKWLRLNMDTFTADAMDNNIADWENDGTVENNVEHIEKTYFQHVNKEFNGVIVGYKDIVVTGYLDVEYYEPIDVGVGVTPEDLRVSKRAKETIRCAVVYYANNKKHYVPLEDIMGEIE